MRWLLSDHPSLSLREGLGSTAKTVSAGGALEGEQGTPMSGKDAAMRELFRGVAFSLYSQVALIDAEDKDSYPQWKTGEEPVVFGPKGVAVPVMGDEQIEMVVCTDSVKGGFLEWASGEIEVGAQGLLVGNIPAATVFSVPWPAGLLAVTVYVNAPNREATKVIFMLQELSRRAES